MPTAFGPNHPFWEVSLNLRFRQGKTLGEVAEIAKKEFPDLTYYKIRYGMRKADLTEMLPEASRFYLRSRYKAIEEGFDAIQTMRDLTIQALQTAQEIEEELATEDLTPGRRMVLEQELRSWLNTAMDRAEKTANVEAKVLGAEAKTKVSIGTYQQLSINDVQQAIEQARPEYEALLPAPPSMESIKSFFGEENVLIQGEVAPDYEAMGEFDDEEDL